MPQFQFRVCLPQETWLCGNENRSKLQRSSCQGHDSSAPQVCKIWDAKLHSLIRVDTILACYFTASCSAFKLRRIIALEIFKLVFDDGDFQFSIEANTSNQFFCLVNRQLRLTLMLTWAPLCRRVDRVESLPSLAARWRGEFPAVSTWSRSSWSRFISSDNQTTSSFCKKKSFLDVESKFGKTS